MSYTSLTDTATGDVIQAAHIQQLYDNTEAMLDGTKLFNRIKIDSTVLSATGGLQATGTGLYWNSTSLTASGGGGGSGSTEHNPQYPAGAFDYPSANPAPLDTDTGTNGTVKRQLFDDTTEEFVIGQFKCPSDITSGDVTFRAIGYAVIAAASKNIEFTFYHAAISNGESWDTAYTAEVSGDLACDATQDQIDVFTWTETVANLGWAAGDLIRFKLSRTAPTTNNLSADYGLVFFEIDIPRA